MTRHCLDTGEPFGVVLIRDGREVGTPGCATLAGVGAFAEIREAGRYPDGRFDLLAAATGRFAIESVDAQTRAVPASPRSRRSTTRSATSRVPSAWPRPPSVASSATST